MTIKVLTSGTSWTVPTGVTSVTVHCIGAGGAGGASDASNSASGGGAGAYASSVVSVTAGNSISIQIGAGGATAGADGTDTWFSSAATVMAKGGQGGALNATAVSSTTSQGGQAASSVGTTKFNGGNGGVLSAAGNDGGGGGGGAAGPNGAGATGAVGAVNDGGGGGGADGGTAGSGTTGGSPGGGNANSNGSTDNTWTDNSGEASNGTVVGPGGGGGGATRNASTTGDGGLYGGGGGGGGRGSTDTFGAGRNGLIVLEYTAGGTSVALTGLAMTSARGTLGVENERTLTGFGLTSARGSFGVDHENALTGLAATSARGTMIEGLSADLVGQAMTSARGAFGVDHENALTGLATTSANGTLEDGIEMALTGFGLTSARGTLEDGIEMALTGFGLTSARGAFGVDHSNPLTGLAVTSARGTMADAVMQPLTGLGTTSARGSFGVDHANALTGLATTSANGTLGVFYEIGVALTGFGMTASRGSLDFGIPYKAFSTGADGFWLQASVIGDFDTTSTSGTALTAYGNLFGRWQDRSGNNTDATQATDTDRWTARQHATDTWKFYGDGGTNLQVAGVGGATTGFYFAATVALGSYYGTIFSDATSAEATSGFRIYHNSDGRNTGSPSAVPVIGFAVNGDADTTNAANFGAPDNNNANQVVLAYPGTLFANASTNDLVVIEFWWAGSGTPLRGRINDTEGQSTNNISSVTAGSTTAYLNALAATTDVGSGGMHLYEVVYTKNHVPDTATRDAIRAHLTNRARSGGARGVIGQGLTSARGTTTPGQDATVALTGLAMTSARGTLEDGIEIPLTGFGLTSARGSFGVDHVNPLTGLATTAARGDFGIEANGDIILTGHGMTSARGSVGVQFSHALTGQAVTSARGTMDTPLVLQGRALQTSTFVMTPNTDKAITGHGTTSARGTMTPGVTRPPVALMRDSFSTGSLQTQWTTTVTANGNNSVAVTGARLRTTVGGIAFNTAQARSANSWSLDESGAFVKVENFLRTSGDVSGAETFFKLRWGGTGTGDEVGFWVQANGALQVDIRDADISIAPGYPTNIVSSGFFGVQNTYRWFRIREAGGTIFFDTASSTASDPPIASDWTERHSVALSTLPFAASVGDIYPVLGAAIWSGTPTITTQAEFDGFNMATTASEVLTGQQLTVSQWKNPVYDTGRTLTGLAATIAKGNIAFERPDSTVALTGYQMTVARGTMGAGTLIEVPLTGLSMALARDTMGAIGDGQTAWVSVGTGAASSWAKVDTTVSTAWTTVPSGTDTPGWTKTNTS